MNDIKALLDKYTNCCYELVKAKSQENKNVGNINGKRKTIRKNIEKLISSSENVIFSNKIYVILLLNSEYNSKEYGLWSVIGTEKHHGQCRIVLKNKEDKLIHLSINKFRQEFEKVDSTIVNA
jgi:hypothetical protein